MTSPTPPPFHRDLFPHSKVAAETRQTAEGIEYWQERISSLEVLGDVMSFISDLMYITKARHIILSNKEHIHLEVEPHDAEDSTCTARDAPDRSFQGH